mmetsp:Transcript_6893/g.10989  ORF Transcript_6893/g.10989 Transcript_6893/m.10989 type:complete len:403 (-) Transcript_6893:609-1817(-)
MLSRVLLIALVLLVSISCALSFQGSLANGKSLKIAPTSAGKVGPLMSAVEEPMDYFDKADKYKEDSRKFRRNVFGHPEWRNHRSSKRYWKNLRTTFNSGVIQGLLLEVLSVVTIATFVCGYNAWVGGETPLGVPDAFPFGKLEAPALPFTLSSPALGLLLVFRTNSAYARWWDARIQWGFTINRTRDFVRNGLCFFNSKNGYANTPEVIAQKTRFTHLVIAYARSVKGHFRDGQDEEDKLYSEFVGLLGQEDADKIMEAKHRPMRIVQELSTVVNNANMNDVQLSTIDRNLSGFCDTVGVCERIFKTPMPLVYTRHTSRFLAIWLLFLPLTLYKELGDSYLHLAAVPASALIATFLLGIEELGVQLEEPFSILPMEVMGDGIEGSCKEMLANDIAMSTPVEN